MRYLSLIIPDLVGSLERKWPGSMTGGALSPGRGGGAEGGRVHFEEVRLVGDWPRTKVRVLLAMTSTGHRYAYEYPVYHRLARVSPAKLAEQFVTAIYMGLVDAIETGEFPPPGEGGWVAPE